MPPVTFDVPEEVLRALGLDATTAATELRLAAAAKLYELRRLSAGAAAKLAGIPLVAFLAKLSAFDADVFREDEVTLKADRERA